MREREEQEAPGQKFWKKGTGSKGRFYGFFYSFAQWGKLQVMILTEALWVNL